VKFSETATLQEENLVISKRMDAWLARYDHPVYSTTALSFAQGQLSKLDRERKGTVSASSLGECPRYQQFVFLGMPKLPLDPKNALKLANGAMMHLRWQMAGLSEGWLKDAEVPVHSEELRLRGTMDGLAYDGSIVELKSINMNGWGRITTFGPLIPHLYQMATYMMCTGRRKGSFIYECKDNQEYREFVVWDHDLPMAEVRQKAESVWKNIDIHHLYPPLGKCMDREGWVYRSCPFRDRCLEIRGWKEVAGASDPH